MDDVFCGGVGRYRGLSNSSVMKMSFSAFSELRNMQGHEAAWNPIDIDLVFSSV